MGIEHSDKGMVQKPQVTRPGETDDSDDALVIKTLQDLGVDFRTTTTIFSSKTPDSDDGFIVAPKKKIEKEVQ